METTDARYVDDAVQTQDAHVVVVTKDAHHGDGAVDGVNPHIAVAAKDAHNVDDDKFVGLTKHELIVIPSISKPSGKTNRWEFVITHNASHTNLYVRNLPDVPTRNRWRPPWVPFSSCQCWGR